jgi:hypothetical protein
MELQKHDLGSELGEFSENEIHESVKALGDEPVGVDQLLSEGEFNAREKKQAVIDSVRDSAGELLKAWEKGPETAMMLIDAHVESIKQSLEAAGKPHDEEGARMLLATGIEALGVAGKRPGAVALIDMIAGSRESVKKFLDTLPKHGTGIGEPLSDTEIDQALDAVVAPEKRREDVN